jgi:hypothetical protein
MESRLLQLPRSDYRLRLEASLARESAPRWMMRMSFFAASRPLAPVAIYCRNDFPNGCRQS